ncbi:hypothetical protein RYH80_17690 [Halobaculum sp. MBLA0147]|uniref:hypothetical protein n=1 Tax=Halobaculum sp. MBLA0147 TaxID=3079934 RepID=UPI003523F86E
MTETGDDARETDAPTDSASPDAATDPEEADRRRLLKWVAILAFAVPVVVEVFTFGTMILEWLGLVSVDGEGGRDGTAQTATVTPAAGSDAVGVGSELLPETAPVETVDRSVVRGTDDRTYLLRVTVANETDEPVAVELGRLVLYDETTVASRSSTGTIAPGESGAVTGAWRLPTDAMPERVAVVERIGGETVVDRDVSLARPPIEG